MKKTEIKDRVVIEYNFGVVGEIRNVQPKHENAESISFDIFILEEQKMVTGFEAPSALADSARILSELEIREEGSKILASQQAGIESAEAVVQNLSDNKKHLSVWLERRWEEYTKSKQ